MTQKTWYDKQARIRQLQPTQKVTLVLPPSTNKLLAKWQGPYVVVRKMGPVTYEIHHPDKKKFHQTYHLNLLKECDEAQDQQTSTETLMMVRRVEVEEEDEPASEVRPQRDLATVNLAES